MINKFKIVLLTCLLFTGCRYIPPSPSFDFSGVMTITVIEPKDPGFEYIRGIFQVKGEEDEFAVYFQDELNMPRGMVVVKKGKIIEEDIPIKGRIKKIFRYWPYLFGSGKKIPKGVKIEYLNWMEVSENQLPGELYITASDVVLNIKINYAD